jgi:hypothetical protein
VQRGRRLGSAKLAGERSDVRFRAPGLGPEAGHACAVQEQAQLGCERCYRRPATTERQHGRLQNAGDRRPGEIGRHPLRAPVQKNQETGGRLTEARIGLCGRVAMSAPTSATVYGPR